MIEQSGAGWQLYRHFDQGGTLLYIGIAHNALVRLADHKHQSSWFHLIRRIDLEHFPTRTAAYVAECAAIKNERPLHNRLTVNAVAGNDLLIARTKRKYTRARPENSKPTISQERLQHLLTYDPETGQFTWRNDIYRFKAGQVAGCLNQRGYWRIFLDGRAYGGHQLAWLYIFGEWCDLIDHRNRKKGENWILNLRDASGAQNAGNVPSRNQTGFKGVIDFGNGKFGAMLRRGAERKYLGMFTSAAAAGAAYRVEAVKVYGEFACTDSE